MKGRYPVNGACSSGGETNQKLQLCGSLPSPGRGPKSHTGNYQTLVGSDLRGYMESRRYRLHSEKQVHTAMPNANQESTERERGDSIFPNY